MNTEEDAKVVHSGTIIGQLSEVAQDEVSLPLEKLNCTNVITNRFNWPSLQREKARFSFAVRFFFEKHNLDLGRTDVVKHQVNIGDSRSNKQQPRRIPAHLTEEMIKPSSSPWSSQFVKAKKEEWIIPLRCRLFLWAVSSFSIISYSYGDVTITGEGLELLTYARHSWPLSSGGSLACNTYCVYNVYNRL